MHTPSVNQTVMQYCMASSQNLCYTQCNAAQQHQAKYQISEQNCMLGQTVYLSFPDAICHSPETRQYVQHVFFV